MSIKELKEKRIKESYAAKQQGYYYEVAITWADSSMTYNYFCNEISASKHLPNHPGRIQRKINL